jgi:hypothetical protein
MFHQMFEKEKSDLTKNNFKKDYRSRINCFKCLKTCCKDHSINVNIYLNCLGLQTEEEIKLFQSNCNK